jgi:hypothetical protein
VSRTYADVDVEVCCECRADWAITADGFCGSCDRVRHYEQEMGL